MEDKRFKAPMPIMVIRKLSDPDAHEIGFDSISVERRVLQLSANNREIVFTRAQWQEFCAIVERLFDDDARVAF